VKLACNANGIYFAPSKKALFRAFLLLSNLA